MQSRRDFVRLCTIAAAAIGLGPAAAEQFLQAAERGRKPSVLWLQFQECTGCTESLLRTSHPAVDTLILDLISLDYHETLFAAAGHQADAALKQAMRTNAGKYVCIVAGSDADFERLCKAMDRADLLSDPRFTKLADRAEHGDEINELVGRWSSSLDATEVERRCARHRCFRVGEPCAKINTVVRRRAEDHRNGFRWCGILTRGVDGDSLTRHPDLVE